MTFPTKSAISNLAPAIRLGQVKGETVTPISVLVERPSNLEKNEELINKVCK